jgi:hypothetical protein
VVGGLVELVAVVQAGGLLALPFASFGGLV